MTERPVVKKCVLVLGATGYLGQFLVEDLAKIHKVGIVHHSTAEPKISGDVHHFWVDLATGQGLHEAFDALGPLDVVVNCAAVSSPAACERHPDHARSINVPTELLDALDIYKGGDETDTLLIQLSTDQVYDGSHALWKESDPCNPINIYGSTKLEAEELIQERWPNHVILRSSIIFGPPPPSPVSRPLFLQFVERTLRAGHPTKFFTDEFRSPVYVHDIVRVIGAILRCTDAPQHRVFNLGGPDRTSRVEMAEAVADAWGFSQAAIQAAPASSVQREVASPADISMDTTRLAAEFPSVRPRRMAEALREMRPEQLPEVQPV